MKPAIRPITPEEAATNRISQIPTLVIMAFNRLIGQNYSNGRAVVLQEDVVQIIQADMQIDRQAIFDRGLLNIESIYREAGWWVEYDKPGYGEAYDARFIFIKVS